jgi:ABC-type nickel/cobalt efflux system permease component RcnA
MSEFKIPGPVFIIVGAGMMLMSVFIGIKSGIIEKFALFIFVGAVFIVIGFFKVLLKEKRTAELHAHHAEHPHHAQHPAPAHAAPRQGAHPHHAQHPQHAQHQHSQVVRCSGCGVKLHPLFKFCPNCGQKLG